jgi:hypothetical protein
MSFHSNNQINTSRLFLSIIFLAGILMVASFGFSQNYQSFQNERDSAISRTKFKLGPVFFSPSIFFNVSYDSNIYGQISGASSQGDYYATLSIPFGAYVFYRNWLMISFSGSPSYNYYFKFKNERSLQENYSPGARLLLFSRISISGNYVFYKERRRFTSEIDRPIGGVSEGYNLSVFFNTTRDTSIGFSGSNINYRYENTTLPGADVPLSMSLNRTERNGRLEFYYRIFSESHFFSNFGYTEYTFSNPEEAYRDSYSYQAYSGIEFPILRGRAKGTLSLGYKKFVPKQEAFKGYAGIVGDTSFSIRTGRFEWAIVFIRDIPFSFGTNIFYIYDNYGGGLSFYLNQNIRLNYKFSQGNGDYPESQEISSPDGNIIEIRRKDTYRIHSAGIVFRVYSNTGIGLMVEFSKRKSNILQANIGRTYFGTYITYSF